VALAGAPADVTVAQKSVRATLPLYATRPGEPFWYTYLASSRTLYVRYLVCADRSGFAQLTQEVFATAARQPVQRLVVDLRGNGGGDSSVFDPFLEALRTSPLNRPGRLFVLIDQGTFSSALLNALDLAETTHATTLGQPTGGKPNSYGEVDAFTLQYSNISVTYATKYFRTVSGDHAALYPAITIDTSYADYAAGKDPAIDAVLKSTPAG
jgi:C-terminal processing protease CtpA/Prc